MTAVLHYLDRWLPVSEQFVHAALSRSRHPSVVVSRQAPLHRTAFPTPGPLVSLAALSRLPDPVARRARTAALLVLAGQHDVGLVHVHFGYRLHDVLGLVRRRRLPLVVSLHGHDVTALLADHPGHYGPGGVLLAEADAVVVPSAFLADVAVGAGARAAAVRVLPSGVDLAALAPTPLPAGPPTVAYVGRLVDKKGLDTLLAAWPAVRAAVPGVRLSVLGDGPRRDLLTGPGGPGPEVTWTRPDPGRRAEQVRAALAAAHVVVTPSRVGPDGDTESLLLVNVEAQAAGRPVVTTRTGGVPEGVAEGRSALLVGPEDPAALAAALTRVLTEPGLAAALAAAGPAVAARFDLARTTGALDDLYDELLPPPPGAPPPPPVEVVCSAPYRRLDTPAVSVCVSTFGRAPMLGGLLAALERQEGTPELEVVVVDNGSADDTWAVLTAAAEVTPLALAALRLAHNVGPAAGRATAVAGTRADLLAFTDDDCLPTPGWLAALVAALAGPGPGPAADLVQGRTLPDPTGSPTAGPWDRALWVTGPTPLAETANVAYRRAAYDAAGGFRAVTLARDARGLVAFGEDAALAAKVVAAGGRRRFAPAALVHHRWLPGTPRTYLAGRRQLRRFPALAGKVGGLTEGPFLSRRTAAVDLGLVGLALAVVGRRPVAALAALPWLRLAAREARERDHDRWLRRLPVVVAGDIVAAGALVGGSARARRLVL